MSSNFIERKDSNTGVFWWILRDTSDIFFTEHLCFCSTEKIFTYKLVEHPLRKEKKMDTACTKNHDAQNLKSLFTSSLHILFKNFFNFFTASYDILSIYFQCITSLRKQCNSTEDLSIITNYFSPSVWKKFSIGL